MLASRQGSFKIVELLVKNGADLMATNMVYTEIYNIMLVCVFNVAVMLVLVCFDYLSFLLPFLKGDKDASSMAFEKDNWKIRKYLQSKKQ